MVRPKLFTRNFLALFTANLLTANCFYVFIALLPMYVTESLKLGKSNVGLIMGAFAITAVFLRPFTGYLLDNVGRLKVYLPSLLLFALCAYSYVFTATFAALFALRLLHGVSWGFSSTSGSTIASDIVPKERRAEGLGYYSMAMNIGMALGPAVGLFLLRFIPFKAAFIFCGALATCAVLMAFQVKIPAIVSQRLPTAFSFKSMIEKRVLSLAFMQLFFGVSYGSVINFAIVYGKQNGIDGAMYFFMIFALIMALTRPVSGKYLDKHGPGNVIGLGFIVTICGLALLAVTKGQAGYLAAAFILGLGTGIVLPLLVAMAMNLVEPQRRGAANATIFTAFDLGIGGGSILMGVIADFSSMSFMYLFACAILIVPLLFYYLFGKRQYLKMVNEKRYLPL